MEHPGEIWQEFDYNGERLGGISPSEMDESKIKVFGGVAVMLYRFTNGEVEFLFQHRSKYLMGNPDKWDVSAGGHTNLDENTIDAMVREVNEEIGVEIDKNKLEFAATYLRREVSVIVSLYFYDYTGREDVFHFNDKEVEEVKWVKYSEVDEFMPNLKNQLRKDKIFFHYLGEWNAKILEKYGNS